MSICGEIPSLTFEEGYKPCITWFNDSIVRGTLVDL